MDSVAAARFVEQWTSDWNAHDLEALLSHYREDVVFTSPVSVQVIGGDGVIRGQAELRRYWREGLRLIPDLHFEVIDHYVGVDTLVINYRNQKGGLVAEVLTFAGDLVVLGHGTYRTGADNPAGVRSR
jgi:ketosteroid isomerase-like protein